MADQLKLEQAEFFNFMHWVTMPFRMVKSLVQTVIIMVVILLIFLLGPVYGLFRLSQIQHDANAEIQANQNNVRVLADFSTNTLIAMPQQGKAYIAEIPTEWDYRSANAHSLGTVPSTWAWGNLVGFLGDKQQWVRGKQAPLYAAYASASLTTDALRDMLSNTGRPVVLPDAPKIGMMYTSDYYRFTLFGMCPAEHCTTKQDYRFRETRELFTPSVSQGQAEAIAELQYTTTDAYWLREAHANGFNDDDLVLSMAAQNRAKLATMFTSDMSGSRHLMVVELLILLLVVILVLRVAIKVVRFIFF